MKSAFFGLMIILGSCPFVALAAAPSTPATDAVMAARPVTARVKDLARVRSARDNQLQGYGLVVGLNGTGDGAQTQFTTQALANMLQRLGISVQPERIKVKNVAAVMVTATIGAFAKSGDRLDITVNSLGDASSLQGGTLLQTPLLGADGKVYAVAQGPVSLGGFSASAGGASKTSGHPTVGRIPNGALVEREIPVEIADGNTITLSLNNPDFTTAARMAQAVNTALGQIARAKDAASVEVQIPDTYRQREVELIAVLGEVALIPDTPARVVINERTGTVVIGGTVTVTPVALAQGNLTVSVNEALLVSQPEPVSTGTTVVEPTADITAKEPPVSLKQVRGTTVEELVRTLNAMKVSARDIIAILQALKQAGALQAELLIQ